MAGLGSAHPAVDRAAAEPSTAGHVSKRSTTGKAWRSSHPAVDRAAAEPSTAGPVSFTKGLAWRGGGGSRRRWAVDGGACKFHKRLGVEGESQAPGRRRWGMCLLG